MKKLLAILAIALVVAISIWIAVRLQLAKRVSEVAEFLPRETLLLTQMPDLAKAQNDWHESDLYQIWREPAVQNWLQKPLAQFPKNEGHRAAFEEFLQLGPKQLFLALTSLEHNEPKLVGGVHFDAAEPKTRAFIEQRQAEILTRTPSVQRETLEYQQHKIETLHFSRFVVASVHERQWYFVSNDLAELKALLDRLDHRGAQAEDSLAKNENFTAASKHLPSAFSAMLFLDPRPFVEKLTPLLAMTGQSYPMAQLQRLKNVQSVASAFGFEKGKMRETDFVAMPREREAAASQRALLATAATTTFFYSNSRLSWSGDVAASASPLQATGLPAMIQQLMVAIKESGVSAADLHAALGEELEIAGDWPVNSSWPVVTTSVPVKDSARARKIVEALASVEISGAPWSRADADGISIFSVQPFGGLVPVRPAISVSDKYIVASSDAEAAAETVRRLAQPAGDLAKSAAFREAEGLVPAADSVFDYVDTRLFYERADAALRPLLAMGASFYPALGKSLDPAKLPPADAITKHLSPIVMSQRYERDGYVTESVGPVTFREATIGLAGAIGGGLFYFKSKRDAAD